MAVDLISIFCLAICLASGFGNIPLQDAVLQNPDLFQGDIVGIDPHDDRNAIVNERKIWPGGIVYYEIEKKLKDILALDDEDILQEAFNEYHKKTCIKFVPKGSNNDDYILITLMNGCYSRVGREGGEQIVSLGFGCHYKSTAIHELGHAIGFFHEQSRSDRDEYLTIYWDNIKPNQRHNFDKLKNYENNLLGESFDYDSVMLYDEYSFSKDGESKTMVPKREGVELLKVWLKPGLSASDVRRVNRLYECFGEIRPTPPPIEDFFCDFEDSLCGIENQEYTLAHWERIEGTLGDRTGFYVAVDAAKASGRMARMITPQLSVQTPPKQTCLSFLLYLNGEGAKGLDIYMAMPQSLEKIVSHTQKAKSWQKISTTLAVTKEWVQFYFSSDTSVMGEKGTVAIDELRFSIGTCKSE